MNRLVYREDVLDVIRKMNLGFDLGGRVADWITNAMVGFVDENTASPWRRTDIKLPQRLNREYIVMIHGATVPTLLRYEFNSLDYGGFIWRDDSYNTYAVDAWMDLPDPPGAEE